VVTTNDNWKLAIYASVFLLVFVIPSGVKAETTAVRIDPSSKTGLVMDESLSFNVTVSNVKNLYAWEFEVNYESGILNASSWNPGPLFAHQNVFIEATEWTDDYDQSHGLIRITCTFVGASQTFNGTTTLATIVFRVKTLAAKTVLHLQNTQLLDSSSPWPEPIAHISADGQIYEILGDINGDAVVNVLDLSIVAKAFGSKEGEQRWNPEADLNGDGSVNILDLSQVARQFGKRA
jgi:hypothetical protein